jgi:hypothetical protein
LNPDGSAKACAVENTTERFHRGDVMLRKFTCTLAALIFVFVSTGTVFAMDKGNKRKGKYTYRKVYKACMARGEVDSPKPPVNPDSKTQAQWTRVFDKKKFKDFGCSEEWNSLSEKELMDIYAYLHGYAADSPTPAKCK